MKFSKLFYYRPTTEKWPTEKSNWVVAKSLCEAMEKIKSVYPERKVAKIGNNQQSEVIFNSLEGNKTMYSVTIDRPNCFLTSIYVVALDVCEATELSLKRYKGQNPEVTRVIESGYQPLLTAPINASCGCHNCD